MGGGINTEQQPYRGGDDGGDGMIYGASDDGAVLCANVDDVAEGHTLDLSRSRHRVDRSVRRRDAYRYQQRIQTRLRSRS